MQRQHVPPKRRLAVKEVVLSVLTVASPGDADESLPVQREIADLHRVVRRNGILRAGSVPTRKLSRFQQFLRQVDVPMRFTKGVKARKIGTDGACPRDR